MMLSYVPHSAFVDESGNADLDVAKAGASTHYVIAAIVVPDADVANLRIGLEGVRARHFQTGEMKSSSVAANTDRRMRVLTDLAALQWRFYAIAIDKAHVSTTGGLIYKKPFVKFMSGKLYSRLFLAYHAMSVVADQHGSPAFMESFRTYVLKNHIPDLFTGPQPAFRFESSKDNVLIQLADFVAGSIARVFVHGKDDDDRILPTLRKHQIAIEEWPPRRYLFNLAATDESRSADDALIAYRNMAAAIDFLNRHERDVDDDVCAQSAALTFLIYHLQHGNPARLVQTSELIQAVKAQTGRSMDEQPFRNRVIAKLRDAKILISAGARGGYKLAASVADVVEFVAATQLRTEPQLDRLALARNTTKLITNGRVDILEGKRFERIRRAVDSL